MLELKIKTDGRRYVYPAELRHRLGADRARQELGDMVEHLLLQLDMIDGDPDFEEDDAEDSFVLSERAAKIATLCPEHDIEQDAAAYAEWHTLRGPQKKGQCLATQHEDDEDSDPREEDDDSGQCTEDEVSSGGRHYMPSGPGCELSDPPELTAIEGVYHGGARPPWYDDDDEPRLASTAWPAVRDAGFYRPAANLN